VAGNFAVGADHRIALDLDESADFGAITDGAPVQIHQVGLKDADIAAQDHTWGNHDFCSLL
jgi:hypothetical protein